MKKRKEIDFKFRAKMSLNNDDHMTNLLIEVDGFTPSRPAPVCNNPSSPLFSDCGDDPDFEEYRVYAILNDDGEETFTELSDDMLSEIEEDIIERIFEFGDEEYYKDYDRKSDDYDSWS